MKRFLSVFPVLLIVCAGIVMMGCSPSDPIPPLSDPDIILEGGKYQVNFDSPKIENGQEYQVIFYVEDCDQSFRSSILGGKICYKMDLEDDSNGAEKVLSGWKRPIPEKVSTAIKTYIWSFKAGEQNDDDLTIESDATTPNGGKQYFSFTAQDDSYHDYASGKNFNVKGKFDVIKILGWESQGTVTLGTDSPTGKGQLSDSEMAKIRAMPPEGKLRLTVNVTVVSSGSPQKGYGIGTVGKGWTGEIDIKVPNKAEVGAQTFYVDIGISSILEVVPTGNLIINIYNCTITNAELFTPVTN